MLQQIVENCTKGMPVDASMTVSKTSAPVLISPLVRLFQVYEINIS